MVNILTIKTIDRKIYTLDLESDDIKTILDVKMQMRTKYNIEIIQQQFYFNGKQLSNDIKLENLEDLTINNNYLVLMIKKINIKFPPPLIDSSQEENTTKTKPLLMQ